MVMDWEWDKKEEKERGDEFHVLNIWAWSSFLYNYLIDLYEEFSRLFQGTFSISWKLLEL